jgi:DNA-binding ferritin-like protein
MGPCMETAQLAAELMALRESMHKLHLKVSGPGSLAAHQALEAFYTEIVERVDDFVEEYQGAREKLLEIPERPAVRCDSVQEAIVHIRDKYQKVSDLEQIMPFSEVVNRLDEIKSLLSRTKYKLLFLM